MKNYSIEEKTYNLLKEIDDKRQITPTGDLISIPFNGNRLFSNIETQIVLAKLEKDHQILSINHISAGKISHGSKSTHHGHTFSLTDKFDQYLKSLQESLITGIQQDVNQQIDILTNTSIKNYKSLLKTIQNQRDITPANENIIISCKPTRIHAGTSYISANIIESLIKKLDSDFHVIKIVNSSPHPRLVGIDTDYPLFEIEIVKENFHQFVQIIENKYKSKSKSDDCLKDRSNGHQELVIKYSEDSRKIILNDLFLIANPDFESENERVFYYLYQNPNKNVTKSEIEENFNGNKTLTKSFSKIVENLNFQKDLRKAFFEISTDSIKFINPVSKERLEALNLQNIAIKAK